MKKNKLLLILVLIGFFFRLAVSVQTYSGDVNNHIGWAKDVLVSGFSGMYERSFQKYGVMTPTYPPVPLFLFTFFYWLYTIIYKMAWKLNLSMGIFPSNIIFFLEDQDTLPAFLKIPAILADLAIALFIFLIAKRVYSRRSINWPLILASLVLFNPAFFYNSSYWGQIEAVPLSFLLASFHFLLFTQRNILSVLFFSLSLLTKQTMIIFIPLFIFGYFSKFGLKKSLSGMTFSLILFIFLFLPFFKQGNILLFPFKTYLNKIQTGSGSDYVTDHAFNFWALLTGLGKIPDSQPFWLGISFSVWGYLIFGILIAWIFYLMFKKGLNIEKFFLAAVLIPFTSFLFLTRMHERYLEPAVLFLLLTIPKGKVFVVCFLFLSFFHFVNLYHNWWAPGIPALVNVLSNSSFVNLLICITIGTFCFLFVKYTRGDCRK